MADQAGSGGQDPFEAFRRLWAPLGVPMPGMAMPTLDPAEVDKRITDLRSVEAWLGMNLSMVKMAIQGLEVQKMALTAMKANAGAANDAANAFASMARAAAPSQGTADKPEGRTNPGERGADTPIADNPLANAMANPMLWPWAMMQGTPPEAPPTGSSPKPGKDRKEGK